MNKDDLENDLMTVAAVVSRHLQTSEWTALHEADLRKHLRVGLDRVSGNLVASFLSDHGVCAGVEMFIDKNTGELASIQILVTRTPQVYRRERRRLEQEFIAARGDQRIEIEQHINLFKHR